TKAFSSAAHFTSFSESGTKAQQLADTPISFSTQYRQCLQKLQNPRKLQLNDPFLAVFLPISRLVLYVLTSIISPLFLLSGL
ncbi:hypothetical protein, partial [Picosynechococcus sp. PCC 7002]|uniref:hypothetical protein n=1 Tax=Picosynechococcus sp. (strain ATCC 27264 / PCC 7002 / PR-6) TaxID=32049 RepID=UPI001C3D4F86